MHGATSTRRAIAIIVNYGTADLTLQCLRSLELVRDECAEFKVFIVDNCSPDDSADRIDEEIQQSSWASWMELIRAPRNGGFAYGNNIGIRRALDLDGPPVDAVWLLNSDTIVREGALKGLLSSLDEGEVGVVGSRLEWPDGTVQNSCFREICPVTELVHSAGSSPISRLFRHGVVAIEPPEIVAAHKISWVSFASVLIHNSVLRAVGGLDEGYFMYFEDADFCRAASRLAFDIAYQPTSRVVHLRGGTSSVKKTTASRGRRPQYYFASRARYYGKWYGGSWGLLRANTAWHAGRGIAWLREIVGNKQRHACEREWRDIWTHIAHPTRLTTQ